MVITINGEKENLGYDGLTITKLLEVKDVASPDMVSVQLNGEIIERSKYPNVTIKENDELDFLYFMGGGKRSQAPHLCTVAPGRIEQLSGQARLHKYGAPLNAYNLSQMI